MPELPEVQTILNDVVQQLGNLQILDVQSLYPGTLIVPEILESNPFPARLSSWRRRGKYMILELKRGHSLIIHLRMTGKLVWDKDVSKPHPHERAAVIIEKGHRLRFIDPRTFGKITLCPTGSVEKYLPRLGAEPLEADFTATYLQAKLKNRSIPIKNALLDQSIVAGLGNIYVCEILYRAGLHPDTPSRRIRMPMLKKLVKHSKTVLQEALAHNGTSISDYRRVDDKKGGFQNFLRVYQKQNCPKGHHIHRVKHSGRSTYYCPKCQHHES